MTTTSGVDSSSTYAALGLSSTSSSTNSSGSGTKLTEQDFLTLMTKQLQAQDPLHPTDNAQFFSQIAQFSTVSGIDTLNSSFGSLSSQLTSTESLQAASLVGRNVLISGSVGMLDSDGLSGAVEVPSSGTVAVQIKDSAGVVVRTMNLGSQSAGITDFKWDGTNAAGVAMPAGLYTVTASVVSGGKSTAASTEISAKVASVSMSSSDGLLLNLDGLGAVSFKSVQEIQ